MPSHSCRESGSIRIQWIDALEGSTRTAFCSQSSLVLWQVRKALKCLFRGSARALSRFQVSCPSLSNGRQERSLNPLGHLRIMVPVCKCKVVVRRYACLVWHSNWSHVTSHAWQCLMHQLAVSGRLSWTTRLGEAVAQPRPLWPAAPSHPYFYPALHRDGLGRGPGWVTMPCLMTMACSASCDVTD